MTTKNRLTNAEIISLDQKSQAGVTKYFTALPTMMMGGVPTTAAKINGVFQADIDATNALTAAESDVKQKRVAQQAARAAANLQRKSLKAYILGEYGAQAVQMLEDCGFAAPKPPGTKTVASKAAAVASAKATRAAGGAKAKRGGHHRRPRRRAPPRVPAARPSLLHPAPATRAVGGSLTRVGRIGREGTGRSRASLTGGRRAPVRRLPVLPIFTRLILGPSRRFRRPA